MKRTLMTIAATALSASVLSTTFYTRLGSQPAGLEEELRAFIQAPFSGVQFTYVPGGLYFFDTRTGDVWIYDESYRQPTRHYRLHEFGREIERIPTTTADTTKRVTMPR
jgi:hypothetical protein